MILTNNKLSDLVAWTLLLFPGWLIFLVFFMFVGKRKVSVIVILVRVY